MRARHTHYGLRQGELLGLKWSDVDLEAGTLQVRLTMSETRTGRVGEATKSGKGRRIELSHTAIEALRSHREPQKEGYTTPTRIRKTGFRLKERHAGNFQEPLLALFQAAAQASRTA